MEKKSENINEKLKVFNAVVILRREGKGGRKERYNEENRVGRRELL